MKSLVEHLNESLVNEFISPAPAVAAYMWMKHNREEEDRRRKQHKEEIPEEAKEIFVIIKPDSVSDKKEIIESIEGAGFKKLKEEKTKLQKSDVKKIFSKVGPLNMKTWDYLSSDYTIGLLFVETHKHGNEKDLQKVIDREVFYLNDLYGIIDDEVRTAVFITQDEKEIEICKSIYDMK